MDATIHQFPLFSRSPRRSRADVDVHAVSRPARAFTGDLYFTHRHGRRLWLVVGDVAGKGIHAAVIMAMIQEELEQRITHCAQNNCDPAVTMARLDLFLRDLLPANRFATMIIAILDDDGGLVTVNAGHCPLLIARADGSVEAIDSTGPVVGIHPAPQWGAVSRSLRRGELLLAYSDGLIEARSDGDAEFGLDRLRQTLRSAAHQPSARAVGSAISEALQAHSGERRDDDVTFIVARR